MDFSLSPSQQALKQSAIDFAKEHLQDNVIARDLAGEFNRSFWKACADFGIFKKAMPESLGGPEGHDFTSTILLAEGLGYGCHDNGFIFSLFAQILAIQYPIAKFGTPEQRQTILCKLMSGEWIGAHALTEEGSGSDVYNIETKAEKVEGGYRLTGKKRLITLAPEANLYLTFAATNSDLGKWGLTAFLVERTWDGVVAHPVDAKMGLRTVPFGSVSFNDCFVPDSHRLGKEGAGFSISTHSLETERCGILANQLGAMERQLEENVEYTKSTQRFEQPVSGFQSVSNRLAEMKLRLETSRLLLYKTAWLKSNDQSASMESALLKLHLSESFVQSSIDSIRNHGGNGYLTEQGIERNLRDSIGAVLYAGTSDLQRNVIARLLGA